MPARRLPPLRALEAFMRTVRLGSARAAAEEIDAGPGAAPARSPRSASPAMAVTTALLERLAEVPFLRLRWAAALPARIADFAT